MEKKSIKQATKECIFPLKTLVLPKFIRAAEALRKAEGNYREAC